MTTPAPSPVPPPPPPGGSRRTALLVGVLAGTLVLVGGVVTAVVLTTRGPSAAATPEEAVREYIEATNDGDCEAIAVHPVSGFDSAADCDDFREQAKQDDDDSAEVDPDTFRIDELEVTSESSDEATVHLETSIDITVDGETTTGRNAGDYTVVKVDDEWVVDSFEPDFGDEGDDGEGPDELDDQTGLEAENAVRDFVTATADQDCDALVTHPLMKFETVQDCEQFFADRLARNPEDGTLELAVIQIEVVSQEEDATTLAVWLFQTQQVDGEDRSYEHIIDYGLEKVDGQWVVTDLLDDRPV